MSKSKSKPKTSKAKPKAEAKPVQKVIAENRKARHRFDVIDSLECGIILVGSEVKSLRDGKLSLDEAYGRVKNNEVWLMGADIAEYKQASIWNHIPRRPRKLLLHRREVEKFANKAFETGLTLVPLKMFFNERGIAKVILGICKGRKTHDKREVLKKKTAQREMDRQMKKR
jgi:SsrA-binding protein